MIKVGLETAFKASKDELVNSFSSVVYITYLVN